MVTRAYFTAEDINDIIKRLTQAEITKEINLAWYKLSNGELPETMIPYWKDRKKAYEMALYISSSITDELVADFELIKVKTENQQLREKLYSKPASEPYISNKRKYRNVL